MRYRRSRPTASVGSTVARILSAHLLPILTVGSQLTVFWLSAKSSLFPGANTMQSIVGTCAQIIAGLYGITMAGYTFFLSRMDGLTASDATLDCIVDSVKRRFKHLIWFISGNVVVNLFVSIFLMYFPMPSETNHQFFYRLFCNEFVLSLCTSILLILYYSILVVDPGCLEKEAAKLKKQISRDTSGSAVEFLDLYDRIEAVCTAMLPTGVLRQLQDNKGHRFEYTLELLEEQQPGLQSLMSEAGTLHRYYECMVNCRPLTASQEMCDAARQVLAHLEQPG